MGIFEQTSKSISQDNLKPFMSDDIRIEWIEGNNLKITFLTSSYVLGGDTLTVNVPITMAEITPCIVYEGGKPCDSKT